MASKVDAWTLYTVWGLFGLPPLSRKGGTATILTMVGSHLEAVARRIESEEMLVLSVSPPTTEANRRWTYWASKACEASAQAWAFLDDYRSWVRKEQKKDEDSGRHD